ncbi:hypothetical protein [Halomonas urumqiensis]|uniref:Uncharacterized protein n=1 Tax=Halomonas urumqiensis TaxID=1684789 RepID=A0A2N7UCH2_9GAMM|nr:hypothetical protein [Halomonas urumqiensis]PMR78124.1 hypothetical protein C1H70_15215 [Halomonas urumqiensis]PTB03274.1 hypothetical protein C6V82_01855 [Halomonas urumqiensis]GHE20566.1 hypothetical protein GCM10017767_10870 [Halomonas urumqiensis]
MPHTLHLGPLRSESLALLLAEAPESLLLITPDEPSHQTLGLVDRLPRAEVRTALLTPNGESITWHRYSLSEFDSQSPATGLKELYPGLQFEGTESRDAEPVQLLVDELKVGDGLPRRLILEQPEQALSLLQALHKAGALAQLVQLDIRSAAQPLYEVMAEQAQLIDWCEQRAGMQLQGQQADDPELPLLHFQRNPLFQQLEDARLAQQQTQQRLESEQRKATQLVKEHEALATEQETLKQQRDEQARVREAAQAESAKLKEERDRLKQQRDELAKASEAAEAESSKLKEERDRLKQRCEEQAKAREAAQAEHAKLKEERDRLKQQRDEQAKVREATQTESDKLKEERDSLKQQREEQAKAREAAQAECTKLKALAEERFTQLSDARQEVSRLKTENQQLVQRQHVIQEEMVKTEAQLDLIKDWVLRESSL